MTNKTIFSSYKEFTKISHLHLLTYLLFNFENINMYTCNVCVYIREAPTNYVIVNFSQKYKCIIKYIST